MDKLRALGCHVYAGGFTVGVARYFDIVGQWEEINAGAKTFELNYPDVPHPLDKNDWPIRATRGGVDLLYGNPPCAPWSSVGSGLGVRDPRVEYTDSVLGLGLRLRPAIVIVESVPRAWSPNGGRSLYLDWASRYNAAGYGVTVLLTSAVLHGAPQTRPRFHFIAHAYRLTLEEPVVDPTIVPTVRDVIGDLESRQDVLPNHVELCPSEKERNVIERTREGEGWDAGWRRAVADGVPCRPWRFISGRLVYDAPCNTVVDVEVLVHPVLGRMLTQREGARLCTYPDTFMFNEDPRPRFKDVTQTVLPVMGEYLGRLAYESITAAVPVGRLSSTVVDWRRLARPLGPKRFVETLREFKEEEVVETCGDHRGR